MISPDDPRLTAYADGMLPAAEAVLLEQELATSPAARAELERLQMLQRALREAFAMETAEEEVPESRVVDMPPHKPARDPEPEQSGRGFRFPAWIGPLLATACIVLMAGAVLIPTLGKVRETARRSVDSSNLRQIGQACLIFASDNGDKLPEATDVWDFARQLALKGGLNDGTIWLIGADPASQNNTGFSTVLTADRSGLEPAFAACRPGFAVVLNGVTANSPATTPIAWTRGLREDGTWSPDSPYGDQGGHVVFLGGNVAFFRQGGVEFIGRDGKLTKNFRDAIPEGARVGEYLPTPAESRAWAKMERADPTAELRCYDRSRFIRGPTALWFGLIFFVPVGLWFWGKIRLSVVAVIVALGVSMLMLVEIIWG